MEAFIAQITLFGGNFAPRGWSFCQGQTLAISTNAALFSILGTTFGGNGSTTFALPDLRGRVAIGAGQGPGLSNYVLGAQSGTESVTLLQTQMPTHNHIATVAAGTGSSSATLNGSDSGGNTEPGDSFIGSDRTTAMFAPSGSTTVAMAAGSVSNITVPVPSVAIGVAGGNQPLPILQPFLAMSHIICLQGIFPTRN